VPLSSIRKLFISCAVLMIMSLIWVQSRWSRSIAAVCVQEAPDSPYLPPSGSMECSELAKKWCAKAQKSPCFRVTSVITPIDLEDDVSNMERNEASESSHSVDLNDPGARVTNENDDGGTERAWEVRSLMSHGLLSKLGVRKETRSCLPTDGTAATSGYVERGWCNARSSVRHGSLLKWVPEHHLSSIPAKPDQ
jgi:hypothetical protein